MARPNEVYYREIAEGLWEGSFDFRISNLSSFVQFLTSRDAARDKFLALLLGGLSQLPGRAAMTGEIRCAPGDGQSGVAYVEVGVRRFGLEIFRLEGRYALRPDGEGVDIEIHERFGPQGSPWRRVKAATAVIDHGGRRAQYVMPLFGQAPWTGVYEIGPDRLTLEARYTSPWGVAREQMERRFGVLPSAGPARKRWERLLTLARSLEQRQAELERAEDPRAPFTCAYALVTRRLAYQLESMGADDPDWVVALGTEFGRRYLRALDDPGRAPLAWQRVFAALDRGRRGPLDQLLLAIGAHVIWDLPHALVTVGQEDPSGRTRVNDFHRVNQVLTATIDPLQARVAERFSPLLGWWDGLAGPWDERATRHGLSTARALAWYNAERLADPDGRAEASRSLQASVDRWIGTFPERPWRRRPGERSTAPRALAGSTSAPSAPVLRPDRAARRSRFRSACGGGGPGLAQAQALARTHGASWAHLEPLLEGSPAEPIAAERPELRAAMEHTRMVLAQASAGIGPHEPALTGCLEALDRLGAPRQRPILPSLAEQGRWDPISGVFQATVPGFYRASYERLAPLIEPDRWDELIDQVVEAWYLSGPDAQGRRRLREVVNVFEPFFDHHPLYFTNDLWVSTVEGGTPRKKQVRYALAKSWDGSFAEDEGHLSVEELPGWGCLVVVHKRIRVAHNPLLRTLLTINPKALTWLLTSWMEEVADKVGAGPTP